MDFIRKKICLSVFLFFHVCFITADAALNVSTIPFSDGFSHLFGEGNILHATDDKSLQLHLNQRTGSGFKSSDLYNHGFFSAKIKLPSDYTAGIVVAFYTTNGDLFTKTHDELDFEFLGNIRGKAWRFQTNMYGNGSTSRGREERYYLWFDPSKEFHRYSILWTSKNIIFYIDDVPIREIVRNDAMGGDYPSKPMGLYATIWDASDWATSGGKYKTNYKYAPFIAEFTDLVLNGCAMDPLEQVVNNPSCDEKDDELQKAEFSRITPRQRMAMKRFRSKYMYYSYCYDSLRYSVPPPECEIDPVEQQHFKETGRLKFNKHGHHRHSKRTRSQVLDARNHGNQDEE
ncbi:PREDICTED: probable xyloglucan endotransglucosylase/hydrolase protein 30 isoform X2 [Nicotiana attenuata]|uniref:Xyloglucan endotransglucosylase/hydrolase n=1 Tax=Nicotiana attenuata TaxID=49451 RepID=A0A314LDJ6_NICAT|nr:PREDICTED: probable xyloglucan endotransglucosylase/hydrolase protein 30 isoform X2 [Nicotiana attenuata]OIT39646.1 putative xyloglucan endotransglucosylasehydrolase protein 30 [Nicotiana attenuata]